MKAGCSLGPEVDLSKFQRLRSKAVILNILQVTDAIENPTNLISHGFSTSALWTFAHYRILAASLAFPH